MNTIDFINIRGQHSINLIEIKIENNTVKNMIQKYNKNPAKVILKGLLFSSATQNDTKKILLQPLVCQMQNVAL